MLLRLRGQAWVVFEDINVAMRVFRELQNYLFYGKPMVCEPLSRFFF